MNGSPGFDVNPRETDHMRNMEQIALADYETQREAAQYNITTMHRTMLIALFAVLVAIATAVIAIRSKPTINVNPAPITIQDKQKLPEGSQ